MEWLSGEVVVWCLYSGVPAGLQKSNNLKSQLCLFHSSFRFSKDFIPLISFTNWDIFSMDATQLSNVFREMVTLIESIHIPSMLWASSNTTQAAGWRDKWTYLDLEGRVMATRLIYRCNENIRLGTKIDGTPLSEPKPLTLFGHEVLFESLCQ